jgi:quercetin dioxygenase-like cupin family protein
MSTQLATKNTEQPNHLEQRSMPNGTLFEFFSSPEETAGEIRLIRCIIPPGVAVPLHCHPDVEVFYVLEGSLDAFQSANGSQGWLSLEAGDVLRISGNTKHALRNSSPLPAKLIVVTTPTLYEFFHEVSKPFDPDQSEASPTSEEIQRLRETSARYGYWMASPQENAAIGLLNGPQKSQLPQFHQKPMPASANIEPTGDRRALQQAAVLGRIGSVKAITSKKDAISSQPPAPNTARRQQKGAHAS